MKSKGLQKIKELFWYSDSEPNEVLISFAHLVALPAALCVDFQNPSFPLIAGAMFTGAFQLYAVLWNGQLKMRLLAVQLATAVAIMTVENLFVSGLLKGSNIGWVIILLFACWNTVRVYREKIQHNG